MSCSEISTRKGMYFNRKLYNYIILVALLTTCLFTTKLVFENEETIIAVNAIYAIA